MPPVDLSCQGTPKDNNDKKANLEPDHELQRARENTSMYIKIYQISFHFILQISFLL